jgi:hypothetical protein
MNLTFITDITNSGSFRVQVSQWSGVGGTRTTGYLTFGRNTTVRNCGNKAGRTSVDKAPDWILPQT